MQDIADPELQRAVYDDVIWISRTLFSAWEQQHKQQQRKQQWTQRRQTQQQPSRPAELRAKLEVITRQSCPRWHADTLGVRALVTYQGPGTLFVRNRCAWMGAHPARCIQRRALRISWASDMQYYHHLPPRRHVRRKWGLDGSVSVVSVDEAAAEQAQPWDILFLKVGCGLTFTDA